LAQTGSLIALGSYNYADYGFRDVTTKKRQDLDAGKYYFKGTFLRGNPGQSLVLRIQNVDQEAHNFSIPDQGVDVEIPVADGRVEIPVTLPQSGAVRFFCKLHADQGMNGQLLSGDTPLGPVAQLAPDAPAF
jgi:plastocyanin